MIVVKSEKELFNLAKMYAMLEMDYDKTYSEFEREEIKESMKEIRNTLFVVGYDVNKFVEYQQMYKTMTIEEYFEFIKTLE